MGNSSSKRNKTSRAGPVTWLVRAVLAYALVRVAWLYLRWKKDIAAMKKLGLPIAKQHSGFLGAAGGMAKNYESLYDHRMGLHEKYGNTFVHVPPIWINNLFISTRDPVVVKHILGDQFNTYVKSDIVVDYFADLLGKGIFAVNHGSYADDEGKAWYFQRKTASKIFTKNKFTGHVHNTLINNTRKIIKNLDRHISSGEKEIMMQTQFFKFTLDTIGDIGFGVDLDTLNKRDVPFANAFDTAQKFIAKRTLTPGWQNFKWLYPSERKIKKSIDILDSFCAEIIGERLSLSKDQIAEKGDILSLFLQADDSLSKTYLRDILMSFFIAGRDTTACTLSFTFLILAQHPEIQEKLVAEILKYPGMDEFITLDEIKQMKYLDGIIRESLRLFPPVPLDGKMAAKDDVLPDGTVVPKGTRIGFEIYAMGRDPAVWKDPTKVIPERWFESSPNQYEFPVFQAGPRICLGKDLAMYEAKFATVEILKRYRFELAEEISEPYYSPGITMTVKNGLKLKVFNR